MMPHRAWAGLKYRQAAPKSGTGGAADGTRCRAPKVRHIESPFMTFFKFIRSFLASSLGALVMASPVLASENGTTAEAEAMVKKAVAYIKANGPEKSYDEFTNGKSFKDRDLYVIVYDLNGKNLAQGANPKLVGKDLIGLKDPDGKPIIKMFVDLAKEKGKGWVEGYKFMNPVSQKIEGKAMYLERVGETLVGCGIYKN
jgi:cytochrome c